MKPLSAAIASPGQVIRRIASPTAVSYRFLLGIYSVLPISFGIVLVDAFMLDHALTERLPSSPELLRLFTVFFVVPHQVASAITFLDKGYLATYGRKLSAAIPILCLAAVSLPAILTPRAFFVLYASLTMYHVIGQQLGITRIIAKKTDWAFHGWKWLSLVLAAALYVRLYGLDAPTLFLVPPSPMRPITDTLFLVLLPPLIYLTWRGARRSETRIGRMYWWSNTAMIVTCYALLAARYSFFTVLIPRVIHDLTAFAFYVVHDFNRNRSQDHNLLYAWLRRTGLPTWALGPLVAIALGNVVSESSTFQYGGAVMLALAFFHYYTESIMWKRNTVHRDQVRFI